MIKHIIQLSWSKSRILIGFCGPDRNNLPEELYICNTILSTRLITKSTTVFLLMFIYTYQLNVKNDALKKDRERNALLLSVWTTLTVFLVRKTASLQILGEWYDRQLTHQPIKSSKGQLATNFLPSPSVWWGLSAGAGPACALILPWGLVWGWGTATSDGQGAAVPTGRFVGLESVYSS